MTTFRHAMDAIADCISSRSLATRIEALPYPFLSQLRSNSADALTADLAQINQLGHLAFSPSAGPSPESMVPIDRLRAWHSASPHSWLVCRDGGTIYGYIHAELLVGTAAEKLINGTAHEGNLTPCDILSESAGRATDFIHIGAIVSRRDCRMPAFADVPLRLVAGLADRVIDLSCRQHSKVPPPHRLIAVDFADGDGRHHFTQAFNRSGFRCAGTDAENNDVYVCDLHTHEQRMSEWLLVVAQRRANYCHTRQLWKRLFQVLGLAAQVLRLKGYPDAAEIVTRAQELREPP